MVATHKYLQASSQRSSAFSDPPDSNDEVCCEEITVNLDPPTKPHSSHSSNGDDNMPRTRGSRGRRTAKQRPTPPAKQSSDDELAKEIKVSPSTDWKASVPAKRGKLLISNEAGDVDDDGDGNDDGMDDSPPAKKVKVLNSRSKKWDPENVTQNIRSPLVNVDLRVSKKWHCPSLECPAPNLCNQTMLLQPAAWDCLTLEDKEEILSLFPDQTHILDAGTPNARPNLESLKNDDNFRHDAEQYTTNLSKGMHDPEWLRDAWTAHQRRAAGEFDLFYIRKLQKDWNMKIPYEYRPAHLQTAAHDESATNRTDNGSKDEGDKSNQRHAEICESSSAIQLPPGPLFSGGGSDGCSKIALDQDAATKSDPAGETISQSRARQCDETVDTNHRQAVASDGEIVLTDYTKTPINDKRKTVTDDYTSVAASESITEGMDKASFGEIREAIIQGV